MSVSYWFMHVLVVVIAVAIIAIIYLYTRHEQYQKVNNLHNASLPESVLEELRKATPEWPEWTRANAVLGFKEYMSLFVFSWDTLGMPSQGIDEVWHAFLKHPDEYRKFCIRYIGRVINHNPFEKQPETKALSEYSKFDISVMNTKKAIKKANSRGYVLTVAHGIPLIFAFDSVYRINNGWYYSASIYHRMNVPNPTGETVTGSGSSCSGGMAVAGTGPGHGHSCNGSNDGGGDGSCGGGCGGD